MIISVQGKDIEIVRPHLKRWIEQEKLQKAIVEATAVHDREETCQAIYKYLNFFSEQDWEKIPWLDTLAALAQITNLCVPKIDFPIFHSKEKTEQVVIEYPEREWYFWLHTMCSWYHWTILQVQEMEIEDAFGLLQEGLINKQQDREWQYSLTELAYPYDSNSKTSTFKPLKKPDWMTIMKDLTPKKTMIRKDMMPQGSIIDLGALYNAEPK